jgi:hypothetical protein
MWSSLAPITISAAIVVGAAAGCSSRPVASSNDAAAPGGSSGNGIVPVDASIEAPVDAGGVSPTDAAPFVPTEKIVSAGLWDFYCGLKAGRVQCWSDLELWTTLYAPLVAKAPPDLVELFMSEVVNSEPALCGIDVRGKGTCWGAQSAALDLGDGVKSIGISRYGTCAVKADGALSCTGALQPPPRDRRYVHIRGWADFSLGLDDTGMPASSLHGIYEFPAATYVRIAMMSSAPPAAIRSDGALVYLGRSGTPAMERPGPFVDVTLTWRGHLCAVDAAGDVTCFSVDPNAPPPPVAPPGPFKQIAAGVDSLCGLRRNGTTTCWGDKPVTVPAGW